MNAANEFINEHRQVVAITVVVLFVLLFVAPMFPFTINAHGIDTGQTLYAYSSPAYLIFKCGPVYLSSETSYTANFGGMSWTIAINKFEFGCPSI